MVSDKKLDCSIKIRRVGMDNYVHEKVVLKEEQQLVF